MSLRGVPAHPATGAAGTDPATTPLVRRTVYALGLGLLLCRLPTTSVQMREQAVGTLAAEAVELDPALVGLAVNVAVLLGVLVFAVVLALYLWLAGVLDRKLVPEGLALGAGQRIGLCTLVAGGLTVLSQLYALWSGHLARGPAEVALVVASALAAALLYRRQWARRPRGRGLLVPAVAVVVAVLVTVV
jgi:hypothetical protein